MARNVIKAQFTETHTSTSLYSFYFTMTSKLAAAAARRHTAFTLIGVYKSIKNSFQRLIKTTLRTKTANRLSQKMIVTFTAQ